MLTTVAFLSVGAGCTKRKNFSDSINLVRFLMKGLVGLVGSKEGLRPIFSSGRVAGPGGTVQVPYDEVGFVDFFQSIFFFSHGDSQRRDADGAAAELDDDGFQDSLIHFIQAIVIDIEHGQGLIGELSGDDAIALDLGIIADASKEVIGDAGGAAAAASDFQGAFFGDPDIEDGAGAVDNFLQFFARIVIQPLLNREAGEERGSEESGAGGGSNQCKAREVQSDGACIGALVD